MAFLNIKGINVEARGSFAFARHANKVYGKNKKDDSIKEDYNAFSDIFMGIIQYDEESLIKFWDCATAYIIGRNFTVEDIEDAVMERVNQDGDFMQLFKEAMAVLDDSGFFRLKAKKLREGFEILNKRGKTKEEKEDNQLAYTTLITALAELKK